MRVSVSRCRMHSEDNFGVGVPAALYGDGVTDRLPADVADVLVALLNADDPVHAALRRQMLHLRVRARCSCGCGTAYFDLDTDAAEPAPTGPGAVVAADTQLVTEDGEHIGEVLVFSQGGYLSWLEVCSWSDDIKVTLDVAHRRLGPQA